MKNKTSEILLTDLNQSIKKEKDIESEIRLKTMELQVQREEEKTKQNEILGKISYLVKDKRLHILERINLWMNYGSHDFKNSIINSGPMREEIDNHYFELNRGTHIDIIEHFKDRGLMDENIMLEEDLDLIEDEEDYERLEEWFQKNRTILENPYILIYSFDENTFLEEIEKTKICWELIPPKRQEELTKIYEDMIEQNVNKFIWDW